MLVMDHMGIYYVNGVSSIVVILIQACCLLVYLSANLPFQEECRFRYSKFDNLNENPVDPYNMH